MAKFKYLVVEGIIGVGKTSLAEMIAERINAKRVLEVVEENPLMMLGLPGILCLVIGSVFGVWMLQIYAVAHHIVTNIALASIAFVVIGVFCLSTAITLHAIKRLTEKIARKA